WDSSRRRRNAHPADQVDLVQTTDDRRALPTRSRSTAGVLGMAPPVSVVHCCVRRTSQMSASYNPSQYWAFGRPIINREADACTVVPLEQVGLSTAHSDWQDHRYKVANHCADLQELRSVIRGRCWVRTSVGRFTDRSQTHPEPGLTLNLGLR